MEADHLNKLFICPVCHSVIAPEEIDRQTPDAYRPTLDPLLSTLQGLLDFEIVALLTEERVFIEMARTNAA